MATAGKQARKLTGPIVEALKPTAQPYRLWDVTVPQLHVRVQPSGVKSWNVQWTRQQAKSLGKFPGVTVDAARDHARRVLQEVANHGEPLPDTPDDADALTVADACRDYVKWLRKEGRGGAADDANRRFERTVYGDRIGKLRIAKLTQHDVEGWRDRVERGDLGTLKVTKGRPPSAKPLSKSTVNRMRTPLVAALNRAVQSRRVPAERAIEWTNVKPYENADNRRDLYLDRKQRRALLAQAQGDVRDLIECIALTGCRPGDPAAVRGRDYDGGLGMVTFRTKGHTRTVGLTPDAKALFDRLAKGVKPTGYLFTNAGKEWNAHEWSEPVRQAAAKAQLPDGVVLYTLRHCWITDAIVGGVDLLTVSKMAGTSLAMIERHYGHLLHGAAVDKLAGVKFL
ncbi:integrase family protein [Lysobacter sp. M15]|uniref:integrase family protein n=1 Tax=Lysobacter sp. M15 TaxID=2916837 RepID=UPI001F5781EF|nr:integrase family protein [Lysobacter sp. M15]